MATVPSGQKFHTVPASVQTVERGSALANSQREIYTMQDIVDTARPYKVFTALLKQSGGDYPVVRLGDETLQKGVTYTITSLAPDDNLIPYGAPNNNVGTSFICNQEISNWGNPTSELSWNEGTPIATVLENTIGNIWFTYEGVGYYSVKSDGLFVTNKTYQNPVNYNFFNDIKEGYNFVYQDDGVINLLVFQDGETRNSSLLKTPIEIRVYN